MKLEKLGKRTYLINGINKVGIYLFNESDVVVIDTGLDDESGEAIMNICNENNFNIKKVFNTHSHADHIGGNNIIEETLNVPIYAPKIEKSNIENPELSGAVAYGGYPHKYLRNKYLISKESNVKELTKDVIPKGIEMINLPGHNGDMVGFKTSDDIYFLSDSIAGSDVISKYKIQFMYNVKDYFKTLDNIQGLEGKLFIPGHGKNETDIKEVVEMNRRAAEEIIDNIKNICNTPSSFDEILKGIFDIYKLRMDVVQNAIIGTTIKCYLSYMLDEKILNIKIKDNVMLWVTS